MALPKEPRQKMINIMYLVLTALLALNVSAEILNAFKTVDNSLTGTNKTIANSTSTILKSLEEKMSDPTSMVKAKIWYPEAQKAQQFSDEMFNYIQDLRSKILKEAGFNPNSNNKFDSTYKLDNLDIATRIMIEQKEGPKLRAKLEEYRTKLLTMLNDDAMKNLQPDIKKQYENLIQLNLDPPKVQDKANKSWEYAYFHMVPTVAAVTILSKFQNDVKTTENKLVAFCHEQVGAVTVRFDQFATVLGQNSNYLMPGQDIEITAGVGAFSKRAAPTITINGQGVEVGDDGVAKVKFAGGGIGTHTIPVHFSYTDQDGNRIPVDKTITYTVGQANASIALDKMNVLYVGVANPISVAASGGGDDKTTVTISNGELKKVGAGKYEAWVKGGDKCTITVSVDGKVAGASEFRVRRLPTPVATIGGQASGSNMNAGAFRAQGGVGAWMPDFPFDLKYTVTSFTISTDSDGGDIVEAPITGNSWSGNAQAQAVMREVKPGKTVYVDNIRATGEDGVNRKLPSLVYYIK